MSAKNDAEVIVAGAGPAGATAALRLARAGVRVLVVERFALPRQKPCGGGISTRVLTRFPYLPAALPRIPSLPVSDLYLEGPSGGVFRMRSDGPAVLLIRRIEFDALLVSLAVEAGARVLAPAAIAQVRQDADCVTLTLRDGRELSAPMVIAADGVNSVIARRLQLNPGWPREHLALDMMEETPTDIASRRRAGDAGGVLRIRRGPWLRLRVPQTRSRQRRDRLRALVLPGADRRGAVRSAAAVRRRPARPPHDGRRIAARVLHAVPDSHRRAAEEDRRSTRAAGRRCRRVRQRLLGRGHLLRDGHRRARRLRHRREPTAGRGRSLARGASICEELAP